MSLSTYWRYVAWYNATTLSERVLLLREEPSPFLRGDPEAGLKRLLRWRSQAPFASDALFALRLDALGINKERFVETLGRSAASMRLGHNRNPLWLEEFSRAFSDLDPHSRLPNPANKSFSGLLSLAGPLVTSAVARFRRTLATTLERAPHVPLRVEIVEEMFLRTLAQQLFSVLGKVTVLELNIARLQGDLEGETQENRYQSFVERLQKPEAALSMLLEYPVLARQLVIRIDQWVEFLLEFIDRLATDWEVLCGTLLKDKTQPGYVTGLSLEGDRHRGGRCVMIATFSSGSKLVYKPKSMAVDEHFQDLLHWINERGSHPALRGLRVLNRGSHGWSEFVSSDTCSSLEELRGFFQRQGAYLALLYVLEATDFHSENLIAAGEHPVLVDLEAIFHPRLQTSSEPEDGDASALAHSVLRVGLLPWQTYHGDHSPGIDISGLGGTAGQLTPYKVACWEKAGTDEMKLSRRRIPLQAGGNLPSLNDNPVTAREYGSEIEAGFTTLYQLLMKHRDELLSPDGPLQRFANDEVRAIFRPTTTYSVLLNESFHPDVMRDALDRDLLFDRLWIVAERWPHLARVIPAECEDLHRGDIPYFSARPNSVHAWSSVNSSIPNLFERTPLSQAQQRLRDLGEGDLAFQIWLIRASLATTVRGYPKVEPGSLEDKAPHVPDRAVLLQAAKHIGDKIERAAIRWNGNASWVGLTAANEGQWTISPATLDLYDGLPGITLFLGYLGEITKENRYSSLARAACNTVIGRIEEFKAAEVCIGAFSGWGGIVYALSHLGCLWRDATLIDRAHELVRFLSSRIAADKNFDIIAGAAGCIGGLLALYSQRPSAEILMAANACGESLIAHALPMPAGVGWITPQQPWPLAGFAHGAAGIAWALLQLHALTGEKRLRKTAEASLAYERSLFDSQTMNWRDLRNIGENNVSPSSMCAWCHGAAGIGLSRVATLNYVAKDHASEEIDAALNTTVRLGFGHNHSLCHGDLGNLEFFLQAGRVLDDGSWTVRARAIANEVAARILRDETRCATPDQVESPGLMTGLSGIGYELLRVAHPEQAPCVLTLEAPNHSRGLDEAL